MSDTAMSDTVLARIAELQRLEQAALGPQWEPFEDKIGDREDRGIRLAHREQCNCSDLDAPYDGCCGGHVILRVCDRHARYNNRPHDPANLLLIMALRNAAPAVLDALELLIRYYNADADESTAMAPEIDAALDRIGGAA